MKTKSDEEEGERERQRQSNGDNKGRMWRAVIEGVPSEGETKLHRIGRTLVGGVRFKVSMCVTGKGLKVQCVRFRNVWW